MKPAQARVRWLYLRALGLVFVCAFGSLLPQLAGLLGPEGLVPAAELLEQARRALPTPERYLRVPTLLWWVGAGQGALYGVAVAGLACSLLLVVDVAPRYALVGAWACYLSFTGLGSVFFSYQWDVLLLEAAFISLPLAPGHLRPPRLAPEPHRLMLLPPRMLLARLMLMAGVGKLASGDTAWRNLTALEYHFWTQPLPNPVAFFAHHLPADLRQVGAGLVLVVELLAPFLLFGPRPVRLAGVASIAVVHLTLLATGNHSFFQLLGLTLCLAALDDGVLAPWRRAGPPSAAPSPSTLVPRWRSTAVAAFCGAMALLGLTHDVRMLGGQPLFAPLEAVVQGLASLQSLNSYFPYAVMTTRRWEVVLEGSEDGDTWREYRLPWRPGRLDERPPLVQPHQPRLDWQLWFAALSSCGDNPWLLRLQERLLRGTPAVLGLLEENPFPQAPPRYVRTRLFAYRFAEWETWRARGEWWQREEVGPYCPSFTLVDGQPRALR